MINNSEPIASGFSINESEPSELKGAAGYNALQGNSVAVQWLQPGTELKQSTSNKVIQVEKVMFEDESIREAAMQNIMTDTSTAESKFQAKTQMKQALTMQQIRLICH